MNFDEIFKNLIWDSLVKLALSRLFAAIPWLGWGPIGVLVGWIVGMFADQIYDALKLAVNMQVIVFRNEKLKAAYDKASVQLRIVAHDKGIESEEFRLEREKHKKALSELVRIAV